MWNLGGGELMVIMLLALIVLGPQKLPDAARSLGRFTSEVRRMSNGFRSEMKAAFDAEAAKSDAETEAAARARGAELAAGSTSTPAATPAAPAADTPEVADAPEPAAGPEPADAPEPADEP